MKTQGEDNEVQQFKQLCEIEFQQKFTDSEIAEMWERGKRLYYLLAQKPSGEEDVK